MRHYFIWPIVLICGLTPCRAAGQCETLSNQSTPQELISLLRTAKDSTHDAQGAECVVFAIRHMEYNASAAAAKLLVEYLDFKRPLTKAEQKGFMLHGPMNESNMYPAIGTLMTFGQLGVPALLSAISDHYSETTSRNAAHALMEIYRSDPSKGIELLKEQSQAASPEESAKYERAAELALQWCDEGHREACEGALHRKSR